jgi:hypothetical protein
MMDINAMHFLGLIIIDFGNERDMEVKCVWSEIKIKTKIKREMLCRTRILLFSIVVDVDVVCLFGWLVVCLGPTRTCTT